MRWIVRGALLVLLSFANLNLIWSPDVLPNTLFAWTLVRSGNVDYDEFASESGAPERPDRLDRNAYFFRDCGEPLPSTVTLRLVPVGTTSPRSAGGPPPPQPGGHVCSIFPPGVAILALPILVPAVLAGVPPSDVTTLLLLGHLAAAILEAIVALLLWSVFRRFVSARWSVGLVLLYFLATSVRTVASQALWQHAGVHLAIAAALWLVLVERPVSRYRERCSPALPSASARSRGRRPRSSCLASRAAARCSGRSPGSASGSSRCSSTTPSRSAIRSSRATAPSRSTRRRSRVSMACCSRRAAASSSTRRTSPSPSRRWYSPGAAGVRSRAGCGGLGLAGAVMLGLYATYTEWWGGRVFGARFLDDLAPVLFAALAWGIGQGLLSRPWARRVFWITAGWSVVLFNAAALGYDQRWDTEPLNVNFTPSRLMDWSDPQWLAVLRALPDGGPRVLIALLLSLGILALVLRLEGVWPRRLSSSA